MSLQLSLSYSPEYAGRETWKTRLEILRAAVGHIGPKEVSFALDVSGSMVSDALNERDRKRWAGEWLDIVKAMLAVRAMRADDDIARDLLRQLCNLDVANTPFAVRDDDFVSPEDEATWQRVEAAKKRKARAAR